MYNSTLPSTSALDRMGCQRHVPAALPPGKTRYPLCRKLGGIQGRSGPVRKISPAPGFGPRTVEPVANRYTDCATVFPFLNLKNFRVLKLICPKEFRIRDCGHVPPEKCRVSASFVPVRPIRICVAPAI